MLPTSPALAAAIEAPQRSPRPLLFADWNRDGEQDDLDDLSSFAESVTVDRTLIGDTPDQVRLVEGYAAASLSAELVRGATDGARRDAAWYFSRLNTASPLHTYERLARPVIFAVAFKTHPGLPRVRRFTGFSRGLPVRADEGTATLTALDGREKLRGRVALPMVVADGGPVTKPGLNGQWPLDYVLRRNGIHASPPVRARCVASVTMHGSGHPEVGELNAAARAVDQDPADPDWLHVPLRFVPGRFALGLAAHPDSAATGNVQFVNVALSRRHPISTNDGASFLVECWSRVGADDTVSLAFLTGGDDSGTCWVGLQNGEFEVVTRRLGDFEAPTVTVTGPTLTGARAWRYLAAQVSFSAAGITVDFRVDGTSTTAVAATSSVTGQGSFVRVVTTANRPIEAWQVTAEARGARWNDDFEPDAVLDPSLNELTAILPGPARDSWELLGEIAAAELATVSFDELGLFSFRTRARWVSTQAQTVQRTLTATVDITALGYDDALDAVRNRIRVPASPVLVGPLTTVWRAPEILTLRPRSTQVVWASFADPVTGLRLPILPGEAPDRSWYLAQDKPSGGGDPYPAEVVVEVVSAGAVKLRITNTITKTLYLVDNTGAPALVLRGRFVTVTSSTSTPEAADAASIAEFGEQPLDVDHNPWRQSPDSAAGLAADLLAELRRPRPVLVGVEIIGDPRLQLGDRVRLQDRDGIGLDGDYWLTGIRDHLSRTGGYRQYVTARQASTVLRWGVGRWGVNVWGKA